MNSEVVEVTLPNGAVALIQARHADGGGATRTGIGKLDFVAVTKSLKGVAEALQDGLRKAAPTKVSSSWDWSWR